MAEDKSLAEGKPVTEDEPPDHVDGCYPSEYVRRVEMVRDVRKSQKKVGEVSIVET